MIEKIIPLKIISEANTSEHWSTKSARHRKQKHMINLFLRPLLKNLTFPLTVSLTRIAPRFLDEHDNLPSSMKWVVDAIASLIRPNLAQGRADDAKDVKWQYNQEKGLPKQYALKVIILEEWELKNL